MWPKASTTANTNPSSLRGFTFAIPPLLPPPSGAFAYSASATASPVRKSQQPAPISHPQSQQPSAFTVAPGRRSPLSEARTLAVRRSLLSEARTLASRRRSPLCSSATGVIRIAGIAKLELLCLMVLRKAGGGIRASLSYSSHEIDEHENEKALEGLQDRVNLLKREDHWSNLLLVEDSQHVNSVAHVRFLFAHSFT
nr:bet1-like SNARE 1-1 [Ipomoea batatas]